MQKFRIVIHVQFKNVQQNGKRAIGAVVSVTRVLIVTVSDRNVERYASFLVSQFEFRDFSLNKLYDVILLVKRYYEFIFEFTSFSFLIDMI